MKIIVDKIPEYPYECRNCRFEGDIEFHSWVCQFIGINDVLRKEG